MILKNLTLNGVLSDITVENGKITAFGESRKMEIPEGCDGFGVKLGGTLRRGQRAWFDNVSVHELSVTREACGR